LVGLDLVALDHLVVGDLVVLLRTDPPVLDPGAVPGVHLIEVHALRLGGRVQLDRHVHEPEGDRAVPDGAGCHTAALPALAASQSIGLAAGSAPTSPAAAGRGLV